MKHLNKFTLLCIAALAFIGCTKTEYVYIPQEGGGNETETKSIVGVWQWQQDTLIFLSFDPWGNYAYVLGQNLMASGSYTFDGTTARLSNTMHGGKQETLTITFSKDNPAKIDRIEGLLYVWSPSNGESHNQNVWLDNFIKVECPYHMSLAGTEYSLGLSEPYRINGTWYDGQRYMQYISACDAKNVLKIKKNGSWQEHSSTNMKYIYQPNIIYRQSSKGDGQIYTYSLTYYNNNIHGETGYKVGYTITDKAISDEARWW